MLKLNRGDYMVYTSYFAKTAKLNKDENILICISRYIPKWVDKDSMLHLISLAPSEQLLKDYKANKVTEEQYKEQYIKSLDENIGLGNLLNYFKEIEQDSIKNNIDVYLICYEAPDKFCHRHLLADLLKDVISIQEAE